MHINITTSFYSKNIDKSINYYMKNIPLLTKNAVFLLKIMKELFWVMSSCEVPPEVVCMNTASVRTASPEPKIHK